MEPNSSRPPEEALQPIPTPPGAAFREFRIAIVPYLLFGVILAVTAQVWRGYVGPSMLLGEVESVKAVIASATAGRLVQVQVDALQRVTAGQPIAQVLTVEPRVLDAQIALSKARIDLIRAGMNPDLRKANNRISFESLRLDMMSKRVELVQARSKLTYYELELARVERLFASTGVNGAATGPSVFSQADVDVARRDVAIASVAVKELNQLVSEIDQAIKDLAPTEAKVDGDIPASIRASINVEERNLDLLEAQMAPLALVAPFDGIVSLVRRHAGETVQPGEAIMTVSKERASRVLAFVRQPLNIEARLGMKIEVRARSGHRPAGFGEVVSVGSQLEAVIPTLLPRTSSAGNSGTSELGLPLLVSLPADLLVHPGELVELRPVER